MRTYSYTEISIQENPTEMPSEMIIQEVIKSLEEEHMPDSDIINHGTGFSYYNTFAYWEKFMLKQSLEYPGVVFKLWDNMDSDGTSEENLSVTYYKNGLVQDCVIVLVIDDYKEDDLKESVSYPLESLK